MCYWVSFGVTIVFVVVILISIYCLLLDMRRGAKGECGKVCVRKGSSYLCITKVDTTTPKQEQVLDGAYSIDEEEAAPTLIEMFERRTK